MRSFRGMKFVAVLAFISIFALGFTTVSFAQFGVKLGAQGSQPSGDLAKTGVGHSAVKPPPSFGCKLGMQGSQPSGDLATSNTGGTPSTKPAAAFGVKVGMQGSQPSGDLCTNSINSGQ